MIIRAYLVALLGVFMFFSAWLLSDRAFFHWKLKAIPRDAWPQMISDLEGFGRQAAESGAYHLPGPEKVPSSLRQLGLGQDFMGGPCQMYHSEEYSGVIASIEFGVKPRRWGLCLGTEHYLVGRFPGCWHASVGTNAFFFVGPRG
jgi:hypothetical protein